MQSLRGFAPALIGGAALIFVSGCREKAPILVLDRRVSLDHIQSVCSVPVKLGDSCIELGKIEVGSYESEVIAAFAADPRCHGIGLLESAPTISEVTKAEIDAPWRLEVDWRSGVDDEKSTYTWWLFRNTPLKAFAGPSGTYAQITPASMVHNACAIVQGVGGRLIEK